MSPYDSTLYASFIDLPKGATAFDRNPATASRERGQCEGGAEGERAVRGAVLVGVQLASGGRGRGQELPEGCASRQGIVDKLRERCSSVKYLSCSVPSQVMRYKGGKWDTVGPRRFTKGTAFYSQLAVSGKGVLYYAFSDGSQGNKLTVMQY